MTYRPSVFNAIHEWDVFTFQRIASQPDSSQLILSARWLSRSADGYLYPLVPMLLFTINAKEPLQFLRLALIAFSIERLIYLFAKNAFRRKRPANILNNYSSVIVPSDEFSFPSGHSSAAFLMTTLLVIFYDPTFMILYIWSALVAASRVVLGVHFPSDVIVGSAMGSTIAFTTCAALA